MRRFDLLTPLAAVVAIGSRWWERSGRTLPGQPEWWLYAALTLVLVHVLLRGSDLLQLFSKRGLKYGTNSLVTGVAVLGILGVGNWLVVRHTKRWDLTKNQQFSLADQTRKVLGNLQDDAKLTYFFRDDGGTDTGRDRLREYEAASPKVKVAYVNPMQKPGLARSYEITAIPTLVVEYRGNKQRLSTLSEQDITNALIGVTREGKKTLCFVDGDGERSIDDSSETGFSAAKAALEKASYATRKVVLLREPKLPEDCAVAVLAGPEKDLQPVVIDAVRSYVKSGGKALVMMEPELRQSFPNLQALLSEWNLEAGKDVVLDVSGVGQVFGLGPVAPVADSYPYHQITQSFRVATVFFTARSLTAGTTTKQGVSAQNLVQTSPRSWAETDLKLQSPVPDPSEKAGPISLGAVATIKVAAAAPATSPAAAPGASLAASPTASPEEAKPDLEGQVVAFGDVDFATNQLLGIAGNADFFLNTVAWLARDTDLISIRPKDPEDQKLSLNPDQQRNVTLLSLFLLPGIWVVLGIWNWWSRR